MNPNFRVCYQLPLIVLGLWAVYFKSGAAGRFGFAEPAFEQPRFTLRCYPNICVADGRGGLLWSFVNRAAPSDFTGANGVRVGGLVRTTIDGVIDETFVIGPDLQETIGIAVQPDGKILVAGRLVGDLAANGARNFRVFRFFTNGVRDMSYQSPVFGTPPRFMTLQPDGKLLAATTGLSTDIAPNGGITDLARLNTDGSLDSGFQRPVLTGLDGVFAMPTLDTNGALYLAGGFQQVNSQSRPGVVKLLANGTLDGSFVPTGFTFTLYNRGILVQKDGKVIVAGKVRVGSSLTYYPLIRLNPDGLIDSTFTLVPSSTLNFVRPRSLRFTADGKLLTVSTSMARFNTDGTLDSAFTRLPFGDAAGDTSNGYWECYWFEQLPDGRLVLPSDPAAIGPESINGQPFNGSVRLLADGTLDTGYSQPIFQQDIFPTSLAVESDGKLLAGGSFDHVGTNATVALARFDTNGVPDANFSLGQSNLLSVLNLAPIQSNQTYVLSQVGDFLYGISNVLVRAQPDGTLDQAFNADPTTLNPAETFFSDLLLESNQPVVVGSRAQALLAQTNIPVIRLLPTGLRDPAFAPDLPMAGYGFLADGSPIANWSTATIWNIGQLFVGDVQLLSASPNGQLLVALGSTNAYQLIRLNPDGTTNASFLPATFSPAGAYSAGPLVYDLAGNFGNVQATYPVRCLTAAVVQSNGNILVSGSFTNVNGTFRPGIARLNPDSTLDQSFPAGSGPLTAGAPVSISGLNSDAAGKIWVSGNFIQWDGFTVPGYVRLNADGTVDTNCVPQSSHYAISDYGVNGFSGVLPVGTDQCYVFGPHLLPGVTWPGAISLLANYPPPPLYSQGLLSGGRFGMSFNSEISQAYWLQTSTDLASWTNWVQFDGTGGRMLFSDPLSTNTQKFYRVVYR